MSAAAMASTPVARLLMTTKTHRTLEPPILPHNGPNIMQ